MARTLGWETSSSVWKLSAAKLGLQGRRQTISNHTYCPGIIINSVLFHCKNCQKFRRRVQSTLSISKTSLHPLCNRFHQSLLLKNSFSLCYGEGPQKRVKKDGRGLGQHLKREIPYKNEWQFQSRELQMEPTIQAYLWRGRRNVTQRTTVFIA